MQIIKHRGDPKKATTLHGTAIRREQQLPVPEWGVLIKCAPYDDHFVYWNHEPEQPSYMCTCGSAAIIIFPRDPLRQLFVCKAHQDTGQHTTGSKRWV